MKEHALGKESESKQAKKGGMKDLGAIEQAPPENHLGGIAQDGRSVGQRGVLQEPWI